MESKLTRITITGGGGQLAQCLKPYFPLADYPTKKDLNVADPASCRAYFSSRSVDLVLHLAAETAPNAAAESYLMNNVAGTVNIALWAKRLNARLVYASTDYVYPGTTGHYRETDAVQPIGAYARSKYAGECAVATIRNALIVRGSWYSRLDWPSAATDAFSSRLGVATAADHVAGLACSEVTGIVNIGGPRRSLYEIVCTEFNARVTPVSRQQFSLPYELPYDSSLNCDRLHTIGR